MARYIDADALIERILKLKVVTDDMYGMGIARGIERVETAIQMQPTADVLPKSEIDRLKDDNNFLQDRRFKELSEVRAEVAGEIIDEVYEKILTDFPDSSFVNAPLTTYQRLLGMVRGIKQKYTGEI